MKRYRVTLKGTSLSWLAEGVGPTEAAAKVCAKLNDAKPEFSINCDDFFVDEVPEPGPLTDADRALIEELSR